MNFIRALNSVWRENNTLLCIGLDPDPAKFPAHLQHRPDAIFEFCRAIVDATADLVCCFKPQIAYFAARRAEDQLEALIEHIHIRHPATPVILDAKRGDIGSTAEQYAIEAFERFQADAVTINPYMGRDSIEP
ncbi:orotidine-5'-phosphate decarboxylase, partial [Accumulibacter sp.]